MTRIEARRILIDLSLKLPDKLLQEAAHVGVVAIDRSIKIKPVKRRFLSTYIDGYDGLLEYKCRICGMHLNPSYKCCPHCGQKQDWSEEEI